MPRSDIASNKASLHLQSDQKQCCALVANLVTRIVENLRLQSRSLSSLVLPENVRMCLISIRSHQNSHP